MRALARNSSPVGLLPPTKEEVNVFENLYSPHNSDSSSDKIDTKLYNKDRKFLPVFVRLSVCLSVC